MSTTNPDTFQYNKNIISQIQIKKKNNYPKKKPLNLDEFTLE